MGDVAAESLVSTGATDIDTGDVIVKPPPNADGLAVSSLTGRLSDGGTDGLVSTGATGVEVTGVNLKPPPNTGGLPASLFAV
jgi:hypothetical protein